MLSRTGLQSQRHRRVLGCLDESVRGHAGAEQSLIKLSKRGIEAKRSGNCFAFQNMLETMHSDRGCKFHTPSLDSDSSPWQAALGRELPSNFIYI